MGRRWVRGPYTPALPVTNPPTPPASREYNSKTLLKVHAARLGGLDLPIRVAQVKADTDFGALVTAHPWLSTTPLVVKPDCLFGKRGKHDLVGLKLDLAGAEDFIAQRMGKVGACKGDGWVGGAAWSGDTQAAVDKRSP